MKYKWKLPGLYPVGAQGAGEELQRICDSNGGELDPHDVVDESRPDEAVLHPCFEWRDEVAVELYRTDQARGIIRTVVVIKEEEPQKNVRAFHHVTANYEPIKVVVSDAEKMSQLLKHARAELKAFRDKYKILKELTPVFEAIDNLP